MTNRERFQTLRNHVQMQAFWRRHTRQCRLTGCQECRHSMPARTGKYADCTASWLAAEVGEPLSINVIWFPKPDKDPNPL